MYTLLLIGVTLSLRGDSIPNDGSGRIVITDINPTGDNNEGALLCLSEVFVDGDWFLHPTQQTTDIYNRIASSDSRGWRRNRDNIFISPTQYRVVRLRRDDNAAMGDNDRALEGVFTCHIPEDTNTPVSVGIYYPSESHVECYFII